MMLAGAVPSQFKLAVHAIDQVHALPGDLHVQRGNWTFYFPLATSLLLSVVLSLLFWLFGRR